MKLKFSKLINLVLCMVLITAMAFTMNSCKPETANTGSKTFEFTVTFLDGQTQTHTVETDKTTVGDALIDEGLIEGEKGSYGLYVKTVCGVTLDYDTDGKYWAFYENGEYAAKGVDSTEIEEGTVYSFKAE